MGAEEQFLREILTRHSQTGFELESGMCLSNDLSNEFHMEKKTTQFRRMLTRPELCFLMEAHNGVSSIIVEEAGFEGIWASGLTIATSMGVRDSNEASWTQVLEVLEYMSDVTSIPILLDADTGYGNFNNFRRLIKKLHSRNIAAVCIEDKLFPKSNSFIGEHQPLADTDEFCGKIKAGKDIQTDDDFCIIARVEALIAGWGLEEALKRAEAYRAAGADGILIHSKSRSANEILSFARAWDNRAPLVIVPTMYYSTPTQAFRDAGISIAIWANHNMRASIASMRDVSRQIFNDQCLVNIEGELPTVKDIFSLVKNDELRDAEDRYLTTDRDAIAVVLAASRGHQLKDLTVDKPKCMLQINGQPILERMVNSFQAAGINDVNVVIGYQKEAVKIPGIRTIENDTYESTGESHSLSLAIKDLEGPCIVSFGDVLFREFVLINLLMSKKDIVLVVDTEYSKDPNVDRVQTEQHLPTDFFAEQYVKVKHIGPSVDKVSESGRWIGLAYMSEKGTEIVKHELAQLEARNELESVELINVLDQILKSGTEVWALPIEGHWLDVNESEDLLRASNFVARK